MVSWQLDLSSTSTGKEVTDKTNKFNLSAFLSLMPRERVIIEILAYNIEPVQGSHFIKLLDNWYVKSGVSEYPIIKQFLLTDKLQLRKVISSLVKKNFIICNNSQNTTKNNRGVDNKYYTVESEWREVILRYIYKVNEYSAIQYIGSNLPGKAYKYSSESKKGIIRYIRDAIYTAKDIDLVFNYINYYLIKCNKDKSSLKIQYKEIIALISEICGKPLDEKWFSMLKPVSQAFYFSIFIKYSFVTFELLSTEMITSIFDYFTRNPKYKINKELFVTFLSYLLLTNNQSNIDVLCFKVQFPAGVKALVDGVRLFFRGKITEAGACFKEARTTVLKAERPFGYFFELFHVLTALSIEDHDSQIWITGTLEKYGNEDDTIWYYLRKFYNGIINNNQKI